MVNYEHNFLLKRSAVVLQLSSVWDVMMRIIHCATSYFVSFP